MKRLKDLSVQKKANMLGLLGVALGAMAQFILSPVVKSYIGIEGLGMWHLLFHTFCYLQIFDLGLNIGIVRELAASNAKGDNKRFADAVATSKRVLTLVGIVFAVFGGLACLFLPDFLSISEIFRADFVMALGLLSCWLFFRYRYSLFLRVIHGKNRMDIFNALNLVSGPGRPLMAMVLLSFNLGLVGMAAGYVLIEATVIIIASRIQQLPNFGNYNNNQFVSMFTFGASNSVISLSTLLIFYSSSFIIGWRLGAKDVAVYQSTIALLLLIQRFARIPFANALPKFINYHECDEMGKLSLKGTYLHLRVMVIFFVSLIIVCSVNKLFVTIWIGQELFAGYSFTVSYGFFIFLCVARCNGYYMYQALGYLKPLIICHLMEIPVNIGLSIILLDNFGLLGIPYAYILAYIPVFIVSQLPFLSLSRRKAASGIVNLSAASERSIIDDDIHHIPST